MITVNQLKDGANFYSSEFEEKIIITKVTPKMVWRIRKTDRFSDGELRIRKTAILDYMNACGFEELR